jgi:uncharacterized membrane protein YcjF (UPF0283 family)
MDQNQLERQSDQQIDASIQNQIPADEQSFGKPQKELIKPEINNILGQRRLQRWIVLVFAIILSSCAFLFIIGIVTLQIILTLTSYKPVILVSDAIMQALIVSVFVQILGVIAVITHALWNDKMYLDKMKNE